jgi:uncharacterized small protein (DUF1192 family)
MMMSVRAGAALSVTAAFAVGVLSVSAAAFAQDAEKIPTPEAAAQQPADQKKDPDVEELRRRIDLLAAEIEQLRSGETPTAKALSTDDRRALGLGPSASAVYEHKPGVSVAGYGEVLFQRLADSNQAGVRIGSESSIDLLRAVLYTGYRFNDRFIFNSELEFEHGGEEVGVEFAYLDYRVNDHLSARGGMLLLPLGLVNEFHEPNVFIGTRRPETERRIIPSTWHENGAGVVGGAGRVSFRAYLVNGMNAAGFTANGLRDGRQGGIEAKADDWAFAGRADVTPIPGVFAGIGVYHGNSGQHQFATTKAGTSIVELHGQAQVRGFDVRGLFARASVNDAAALDNELGLSGGGSIGSVLRGGYAQVAYNLLSQQATTASLAPFYRFEQLDTQAEVPAGFVADPSRDARLHTIGIELKPIGNIALKVDYQRNTNKAETGRNQFNVSLGYAF